MHLWQTWPPCVSTMNQPTPTSDIFSFHLQATFNAHSSVDAVCHSEKCHFQLFRWSHPSAKSLQFSSFCYENNVQQPCVCIAYLHSVRAETLRTPATCPRRGVCGSPRSALIVAPTLPTSVLCWADTQLASSCMRPFPRSQFRKDTYIFETGLSRNESKDRTICPRL